MVLRATAERERVTLPGVVVQGADPAGPHVGGMKQHLERGFLAAQLVLAAAVGTVMVADREPYLLVQRRVKSRRQGGGPIRGRER